MTTHEMELHRAIGLVAKQANRLWAGGPDNSFSGYLECVLDVVCGVTAAPYEVKIRRVNAVSKGEVPKVSGDSGVRSGRSTEAGQSGNMFDGDGES